ncbi:hypothetical protein [Dyella acidiphila]|uniref:Uncharacterized protein n=1 Tax=Dyella acidiphila TaxID=2775866 RepID=A0ABR9G6I7_9GAMM|nr:hypothetical protein [Dyella acidiphila]MBE1159640.1 hypothetical protein [Dyella acidiphila]
MFSDKPISDTYAIYNAYTDQIKKIYDDFAGLLFSEQGNPASEAEAKQNFVERINAARKGRDLALSILPPDPNPAK